MQVFALEVAVYAMLTACTAAGLYLLAAAALRLPGIRLAKAPVSNRPMARTANTLGGLVLLGFPLLALSAKVGGSGWGWLIVAAYGGALACSVAWAPKVDHLSRRAVPQAQSGTPGGVTRRPDRTRSR